MVGESLLICLMLVSIEVEFWLPWVLRTPELSTLLISSSWSSSSSNEFYFDPCSSTVPHPLCPSSNSSFRGGSTSTLAELEGKHSQEVSDLRDDYDAQTIEPMLESFSVYANETTALFVFHAHVHHNLHLFQISQATASAGFDTFVLPPAWSSCLSS
jgi:hypothetical protein